MAKKSGSKSLDSARKKNGFTQSSKAKAPKTMSDYRSNNGFIKK